MLFVIVRELQNANSQRNGCILKVKNLTQAKRLASRNRGFFGTVLTIESENGTLLSTKKNGDWINTEQGDNLKTSKLGEQWS